MSEPAAAFGLASCAATQSHMTNFTEMAAGRIRPAGVQVVEVRAEDLKELPSGRERALAFENTRNRDFWASFSGPVIFIEPLLPASGSEMDDSLLPPRNP
ncbi:MAG: hypothetical protein WED15_03380 [Akkermansiaceae bacterium]